MEAYFALLFTETYPDIRNHNGSVCAIWVASALQMVEYHERKATCLLVA